MADKKYKIGIETTADTSGAKEAERAIDAVGGEAKRTERETESLEASSRKLNQELARTGNTSEGVASKMGGRLKGTIAQAGFQIQDFAVQVGGGTSAMTAFGQQAPQFLGAFGPAGSIAGAIISIGAVAFNVFSKMGDDAATATEKAETLATAIEQIAKNKVEELNEGFAETAQSIDLAAKRAQALKTGIEDVIKSEGKLALARIDRQAQERELATAEANAKLLKEGKPIDTQRVANDALTRTLEKQAEITRQANQGEQLKVKAAQDTAQAKAAELKAAEDALRKAQETLAREREKLAAFRQQTEELKKAAVVKADIESGVQIPTAANVAAQKKLDDPVIKAERAATEKLIADLEKKTQGPTSELNKAVSEADIAALAARVRVANAVAAANNNRQAIASDAGIARTKTFDESKGTRDDTVVNQLQTLVSGIGEKGGKDLAPFIAEMKNILQDKSISADELARIPTLLAQYFGKIANLGAAQNQTIREAMSKVDDLEREMRTLKTAQGSNRGF
jgi:hypothetical protein